MHTVCVYNVQIQEVFCERVINIPDFTLQIERSWISQLTDRPGSRLFAEVLIKGSLPSYDWFQVMDKHKTAVYHLPSLVIKTLHLADQLKSITGGSQDHIEKTDIFPVGNLRPPLLSSPPLPSHLMIYCTVDVRVSYSRHLYLSSG